jgi:hypothetical protein
VNALKKGFRGTDLESSMKTYRWIAFAVALSASGVLATPTQQEVFKSDNVGQKTDSGHFLAVLLAIAAVAVFIGIFSKRERKAAVPRALNHQGKLIKEIMKGVHLRPAEVRQLRTLADAQDLENPLTLLLCPSVLEKAIKERPKLIERKVMLQITRKMGMVPAGKREARAS